MIPHFEKQDKGATPLITAIFILNSGHFFGEGSLSLAKNYNDKYQIIIYS